jgi:hypothetical protein
VNQNSVRVSSGSIFRIHPTDQGRSRPRNETATGSEARNHITYEMTEMYASSGIRSPA